MSIINENSVNEFNNNSAVIKCKKICNDAFFLNNNEKNTAIKNDNTFIVI